MDLGSDRLYDAFIGFAPHGDLPGGGWDFASLDIIVDEAGGAFTNLWGELHHYNKPRPKNSGGLLVAPDDTTHGRILAAVRPALPLRHATNTQVH